MPVENTDTDSITDIDSDSSERKSMNLQIIFESTLERINKFITSYKNEEVKINDLENDLMSTLKLEKYNQSVVDERYKINLFNDEHNDLEERCLNELIQKCQNKIIDNELCDLLSCNDEIVIENSKITQVFIIFKKHFV